MSKEEFLESLSKFEGKVLVDFWAPWCLPCKMAMPIIDEISQNHNVIKVNIEENPELTSVFNIASIPAFIVFENGKEVDRVNGFVQKEKLEELLN
jgi:thioredoxin 1